MSTTTSIEWTRGDDGLPGKTWNPVTGCSKVSPGCKNCYAEAVANRFWKGRKFTDVQCHPERLDQPLRWRKPSRIFVNSMSDLFHEDVPFSFIKDVWLVMHEAHQKHGHTFQILTKRPERMLEAIGPRGFGWYSKEGVVPCPEPGIWLGVSVENQETRWRIDVLREVPAAVRFLSLEPLLEDLGALDLSGIDWVILGGESGPGARPCNVEWIRGIVRQCKAASVPVFVKQLGSHPHYLVGDRDTCGGRLRCSSGDWRASLMPSDRKGGEISEWPEDLRVREFPRDHEGAGLQHGPT